MEGINNTQAEAILKHMLIGLAESGANITDASFVMVKDPCDGVVRPFLTVSVSVEADSEEAAKGAATEFRKFFPVNAALRNEKITLSDVTLTCVLSELIPRSW